MHAALGFSRDTEPIGCAYSWKEMTFKESAHVVVEAGEPRMCRLGGRLEAQESRGCGSRLRNVCCRIPFCLGGVSPVF